MNGVRRTCLLLAMVPVLAAGALAGPAPETRWSQEELLAVDSMRLERLPRPPPDPSNRYADDPAVADFGRTLFFDKRLSGNGQVACASCHDPSRGFQDDRAVGIGVGIGRRRSMPIVDAIYGPWRFWDGRKDSLWSQALGPLEDPAEHGGTRAGYVRLLAANHRETYQRLFGALPDIATMPVEAGPLGTPNQRTAWAALPLDVRTEVTRAFSNMGKAIAAFERTLRHSPTRFDRYADALARGHATPSTQLTADEVAGLRVFIGRGQCLSCHNGPLLSDASFHNTGVPVVEGITVDRGRGEVLARIRTDEFNCLGPYSDAKPEQCEELVFLAEQDASMIGAFKTPGLRGVANRPPYMHAGQFASLEVAIRHYTSAPAAAVGHSELAAARRDHGREPIRLTEREVRQLGAFLETLSPEARSPRLGGAGNGG